MPLLYCRIPLSSIECVSVVCHETVQSTKLLKHEKIVERRPPLIEWIMGGSLDEGERWV